MSKSSATSFLVIIQIYLKIKSKSNGMARYTQKQQPIGIQQKNYSQKFMRNFREISVPESLF